MDFQLNDEQLHLKKSVREFAEREILPNVMKWDEAGEFPLATIKELGKLGMLGTIFPVEYGGAGMGYVEYVTVIEELSRVDGSVGIIVAAHTSLGSNHIFRRGQRVPEKEIHPEAGERRVYRRVGTDRAVLGLGRGQRAYDRNQGQGRVGSERHQDVHHQRTLRRRAGRACGHRSSRAHSWAFCIHRRERHEGVSSWQKREQARPAGERHGGTDF